MGYHENFSGRKLRPMNGFLLNISIQPLQVYSAASFHTQIDVVENNKSDFTRDQSVFVWP